MTTIQFSTGQAFDLPEPVDPSAEHQLALTIRNNPLARHLAPVLQGSLDIWAEMRVPVNDFHAVLTSIVVACDANPNATVSVEGFEDVASSSATYESIRQQAEKSIRDAMAPAYVGQAEQLVRAMVLGPDDVLVIAVPVMSAEQFDATVTRLNAGPLAGRIVLVEGAEQIVQVQGRNGGAE